MSGTDGEGSQGAYDAIILGAGAGGLSAAAYFLAARKRVLVVEASDHVGGRASSSKIEGFTINEGAIAVEVGGALEQTFAQLGVPLDVREPSIPTAFRIDGKLVDVSKGGWGILLNTFTKQAAKIGAKIADARGGDLPEARISTQQWLATFTKNETVHAVFRNLCAGIFAANSDELPARAFLTHFGIRGALKRFGYCSRGTGGIWDDLADAIRDRGGEILLNTRATGLRIVDGRVTAVEIMRDAAPLVLETRTVISNIGPSATVALDGAEGFGAAYIERATSAPKPAAMIKIYFASQTRLIDSASYITFGKTRRLCNIIELTATCPEVAPDGWFLYVAFAVPRPAIGDFNEEAEIAASLQDLRDEFPNGFNDQIKMLSIGVMRDGWPAQRSCAGYDLEQDTPLENLWHVGDAVKGYGDGGMPACATTGRLAVEQALKILT